MAESEGIASLANPVKDTLSKKVGPLPVWGYAALGMGVLFLYSRNKRGKVRPASAATATPPGEAGGFTPDSYYSPGAVTLGQGYVPSTDETNAEERTIWTNNDWVFQAAKRLAPSHPEDSTNVLRRLRQYISGAQLEEGEYAATIAIAEEAIQKVGPPPEPFVPATSRPTVQQPSPGVDGHIPPQPAAPSPSMNDGTVKYFTLSDFGGSIESAADHYFGDPNAWYKFRVDVPGGDPNTGWINVNSYRELQPHTRLAVNPDGRIRD